jgi:plastocyanin
VEGLLVKALIAASGLAVLLMSACGGSSEKAAKAPETAAGAPGLTPDTINGATLTGKISFTGPKPVLRMIDMSANPACQKAHPSPVASEEVVVNGDGSLANVFVWVKAGLPGGKWAAPPTPAVVDQQGCIYTPHVTGVVVGQPVEFRNSDETNHNIHPLPRQNQEWNESQPPKGDPKTKSFDQEEVMVPVKCNIHPWMRAYIGVVRHPFFGVSGADGTFKIAGLPPGEYTVEAWHERFGRQEMEVSVAARDSKSIDFSFAAHK